MLFISNVLISWYKLCGRRIKSAAAAIGGKIAVQEAVIVLMLRRFPCARRFLQRAVLAEIMCLALEADRRDVYPPAALPVYTADTGTALDRPLLTCDQIFHTCAFHEMKIALDAVAHFRRSVPQTSAAFYRPAV